MDKSYQLELIPKEAFTNQHTKLKIANEFIIAKYKLKLLATKMWFAVLSTLKESDNTFFKYKFKIKDLATAVGISTNKGYIKIVIDILDEIASQRIQIIKRKDVDIEKSKFLKANIFSSIEYLGNGEIEIIIDPKLHEYFFELKNNFTVLEIQELLEFDSMYAIRIYQLIKQYISIGTRPPISVEEFKSILMIEDKYSSFADIRRFVLEPSIKIINKKSSLKVGYTSNGSRGKKTTEIVLFGEYKSNLNDDIKKLSDEQKQIYNSLIKNKISKTRALYFIENYELNRIQENLNYALQTKRKNIGGFISKAIEDDYYSSIREEENIKKENKNKNEEIVIKQYKNALLSGRTEEIDLWEEACKSYGIDIKKIV